MTQNFLHFLNDVNACHQLKYSRLTLALVFVTSRGSVYTLALVAFVTLSLQRIRANYGTPMRS